MYCIAFRVASDRAASDAHVASPHGRVQTRVCPPEPKALNKAARAGTRLAIPTGMDHEHNSDTPAEQEARKSFRADADLRSGGATSDSTEGAARPISTATGGPPGGSSITGKTGPIAGTTGGGATVAHDTETAAASEGVAGGTSGETGSASGTDASADEAAGGIVADERTEPSREDERRENPRGPGLQPRPDLRGA